MYKQTLFVTQPAHLSLRRAQLVLYLKASAEEVQRPIEDIGFLVLEHPQITVTHQLLGALSASNVAVVCCNRQHMPNGILLSFDAHSLQTKRFITQVNTPVPLKKQLWKRTVKAKVAAQAKNLTLVQGDEVGQPLQDLLPLVKSGDVTNVEGRAARYYWQALFGENFLRHPAGPQPNAALNYGYAILRAAMARALAGHGLLNTLGIHHRNQYNAFCLADDIMEPYRPFVDLTVYEMVSEEALAEELTQANKAQLLSIVTMDADYQGSNTTLGEALSYTAYTLATAFEHKSSQQLNFATCCYGTPCP